MAKIESYAIVNPPVVGGDMLIGTDVANLNATKNFTVSQLASFINAAASPTNLQTVLNTGHSLTNELNFQGTNAGLGTTGSNINAFGIGAAAGNVLRDNINAFGTYAASGNSNNNINAIGYASCGNNSGASVNAIGVNSADGNTGDFVNAIGEFAAFGNTGHNVIALGYYAAINNTLSNVTVISNSELPSYVDFTAASAALNVAGATTGCTYLYHDQATNSIGAVRIP